MEHAAAIVLGLIAKLAAVVTDAIGLAIAFLRRALEGVGVTGPIETLVLVFVAVLLVITAFQVFGRLFLVLLLVFLVLVVLGHLAPRPVGAG